MNWHPRISEKQAGVINDRKHPYRLLSGPRRASKSLGGLHALCEHAWNTKGGVISICGRTLTDNFDGGAWSDLLDIVMPEWIEGRTPVGPFEVYDPRKNRPFGFKLVTTPRMHALTHKLYCTIRNRHGGTTRIQLDSVKNEHEVERIYKGKRFSMVYMTEASNFKSRTTFDVIEEALRVPHLTPEEHLFILDTNPDPDGEDSWIYQLFFEFRLADDESLLEHYVIKDADEETRQLQLRGLKEMQAKLSVHEFTIDDNIFITDAQKRAQFAKYAHNPDLLARYYYGKWKKAARDSVFKEVFRPHIHIIGDSPESRKDEPTEMTLEENCSRLGSGWDMGDVHNAIQIIEDANQIEIDTHTKEEKQVSVFKVLDEFVLTDEPLPLVEIVTEVMEIMDYWEDVAGTTLMWENISDRSAFDRYDKIADTYEYKEVFVLSDGRVELQMGPTKKRHSIQQRVNLMRRLFFQDRLFISARCVKTIEMINNLRKGRITAVDLHSIHKHPFDSLTYYLALKCFAEMERDVQLRVRPQVRPSVTLVRL